MRRHFGRGLRGCFRAWKGPKVIRKRRYCCLWVASSSRWLHLSSCRIRSRVDSSFYLCSVYLGGKKKYRNRDWAEDSNRGYRLTPDSFTGRGSHIHRRGITWGKNNHYWASRACLLVTWLRTHLETCWGRSANFVVSFGDGHVCIDHFIRCFMSIWFYPFLHCQCTRCFPTNDMVVSLPTKNKWEFCYAQLRMLPIVPKPAFNPVYLCER